MVNLISNLLAVVLLAAVATVSAAREGAFQMVASHARPAGCHQHDTAPVPQPVSYRCCQSGHDSAILQISFTSELASALIAVGHSIHVPVPTFAQPRFPSLATSSADPPDINPLRV